MLARSSDLLDLVAEPGPGRIRVLPAAIRPEGAQRWSCGTAPPFRWILPQRPDRRRLEEALARDFDVEVQTSGNFRVLRAIRLKLGGCAGS
jgi:hypothetical protein